MADFPPNLDDGELWLPSDIFPDDVSAKFSPKLPSELTNMENLSKQLSAYALLERNQTGAKPPPNLVPNLEVRPASRNASIAPPRTGLGFEFDGGVAFSHNLYPPGNARVPAGSRPVYQHPPIKPAQAQADNYLQTRARVLERPQNQGQNRLLPFRVNGPCMGGFVRESGGTGVFFPRVATATDVRKKQSLKNGGETQQTHPMKEAAVGKQEVGLQPPPEMGLPKDWTY